MSLRKKTFVIVAGTLLGLCVLLYAAGSWIVLRGYAVEEDQNVRQTLGQVVSAEADDQARLAGTARDWAGWDDTYAFAADRNTAFIQSNLAPDSVFDNNRLSLIILLDAQGHQIYGRAYDLGAGRAMPVPASLAAYLAPGSRLLAHPDTETAVTGLLSLPEGLLEVSAQPIVTSDRQGPVRGTLLFGHFLDAPALAALAAKTHVAVTVQPLNGVALPDDVRMAQAGLPQAPGEMLSRPLDDAHVAGYALVRDVYGNAAGILRVDLPRSIYARGQATLWTFLAALVGMGLLFSAGTMLLLERLVLARLGALSAAVGRIGAGRDLRARLPAPGHDELGRLAGAVNGMLSALEQAEHDRQAGAAALQASEQRGRAVFENAFDGLLLLDAGGRCVDANPAACDLLGRPLAELLQADVLALVVEDGGEARAGAVRTLAGGVALHGECRMGAEGSARALEYRMRAQVLPGYDLMVLRDMTERKRLETALGHQAFHDALTGLPNRALFRERLAAALAHSRRPAERVAVVFLDLDDFKVVNDSLGHKAGDAMLTAVAARLQAGVRPGDMVARLGGDEFTVLLQQVATEADAASVAERIQAELQPPFLIEGQEVTIRASIGIALGSAGVDTPGDLLRSADVAMYAAKEQGKAGYAFFAPEMDGPAWTRIAQETALRHAIERQELHVHYQPIVHLATGAIRGVEALVRWEHPTRGSLMPSAFVPLAEETGLIVPLGRWVLREACAQVRAWQAQGICGSQLMLSVNISPRQFRHPVLVEEIRQILAETGFDPRCLQLEVTESMALDAAPVVADRLDALHRLGIRLAIDDFGTGYTAWSSLRRFPISAIKLDHAFVHALGQDARTTAVLAAILDLARALEMEVTAEGVETPEQLAHVRELGCVWAQGRYFSAALPPEVLAALFALQHSTARPGRPRPITHPLPDQDRDGGSGRAPTAGTRGSAGP